MEIKRCNTCKGSLQAATSQHVKSKLKTVFGVKDSYIYKNIHGASSSQCVKKPEKEAELTWLTVEARASSTASLLLFS